MYMYVTAELQLYWRMDKGCFVLNQLKSSSIHVDKDGNCHELNTLFKSIKATKVETDYN